MKIKNVSWKNFGSYGNSLQRVQFDEAQGNFYIVLGGNGAGKSTISDVIKFSLYGKVDGKKLKDLPNRFNGGAYVKVEIEKNSSLTAVIERGIAPSILRLWVNGVEYDQAGKKNIQEFIEEEILGIPYYVFNNMVSLSINDFKSFISMGAADKRMIIDRLFGLEIIGAVRWKVKYYLKSIKDSVDGIEKEISIIERGIASSVKELESLTERLKSSAEEKKKEIKQKIEKLNTFLVEGRKRLTDVSSKEKSVKIQISEITEVASTHKAQIKICEEKISLYKKGKCPTCESDLTTDFHKSILQEYINKSKESLDAINEILVNLKDLKNREEKIRTAFNDLNGKIINAESQVRSLNIDIERLSSVSVTDEQTDSLNNIINESNTKKTDALKKKDNEEKKINFYKIIDEIFGDKGVKLSAIKKILPVLNLEIKKVLLDLSMDYKVMFNQEFEAEIQHLGFKVSVEQLSTGERKKIDFAALIALIRLMKLKFAGLNLIFLDEIFSSIDSDSIYHVIKVLHKTCRELNLNVFVINHSPLPTELFDYSIEVGKKNGFSNITLTKNV